MTTAVDTLAAVPREPFIPDTIYVSSEDTGWLVPLHRDEAPDTWHALVHSDEPVVTTVDYDPRLPAHLRDATTGRGVVPASSSSGLPIMARILDALDLAPGMRVLEVGTGTGYNAALLTHITGPGMVTTVEVDPQLAEHARAALSTSGYEVQVVTGNGVLGHPLGAPYDRVVATAAVRILPYAWVGQTRPGGLIVTPWAPTFHPDGPLAVLVVGDDGTARGRFVGSAFFMPLHEQRLDAAEVHQAREWWEAAGKPDCERFGVAVGPEGQQVWLDRPENRIAEMAC